MKQSKIIILIYLIFCISLTLAKFDHEQGMKFKQDGFKSFLNHFGQQEYLKELGDTVIQHVAATEILEFMHNPIAYAEYLQRIMKQDRQQLNRSILECQKGGNPNFFKFTSYQVGKVGSSIDNAQQILERHTDDCFDQVQVKYQKTVNGAQIDFEATGPSGNCQEVYFVGSTLNFNYVVLTPNQTKHTMNFYLFNQNQIKVVDDYGLYIFRTCDKLQNLLPDFIMTLSMFMGGFGLNPKIPFFGSRPTYIQEEINVDFVKQSTGWQWNRRDDVFIDLNDTQVQSGDFLAITRFDGLDNIIQYGAGSHAGHSAVLMEFNGTMYVCESQAAWYWPRKNIQRNPWQVWKQWAQNAGFNVAVLPLSPQARAQFNVTAAEEWFTNEVEGLPYGYHNFIFGWVDTVNSSYPPVLDPNFVPVAFSFLELLIPGGVNSLMGQAMVQRLIYNFGYNMTAANKTLEQFSLWEISEIMSQYNTTFPELFAQVEEDGWVYSDGMSYVCSAFAAGLYKAGGLLLNNNTVQATEFTPRDVYTLNIFDNNYKRPIECQLVDPDLPYCQIMGRFKMELPGYNSIPIYPHMCENCPTEPPMYLRPDGC